MSGLVLASGTACLGRRSSVVPEPQAAEAHAAKQAAVAHWPLPPETLEAQLRSGRFEILEARYAGAGLTGAQRLRLRLLELDDLEIRAKWKAMPSRMDGVNNSPRKEVAAYALQKLFLEPEDYVVPTSVARCIPVEAFPEPENHRAGPFEDLGCELGVLSAWLDGVQLPDTLYEADRFAEDPVYAAHLGRFNLATYLMLHQDGRSGNFLVSVNEADRRVFAVDNGVAFSGIFYNWFVRNWKSIHVPAIPEQALATLRRLDFADVRALETVVELHRTSMGGLEPRSASEVLAADKGVRMAGDIIQMGLTEDEIEDLWERIEKLLEDVDEGELGVLPAGTER